LFEKWSLVNMTFSQGCINANSAGGYGLYTTNGVTAYANWWGSSSGPNRTGTSNGTRDALYGTAVYVPYATNAIACGVTTPTATPTITRTPTPTFTPSPTPLPPCTSTTAPDVMGSAGTPTAPIQGQVSTYGQLTFMTINTLGVPIGTPPATGPIWPPNTVPSIQRPAGTPSLNWNGSEIVAYLGVIPWVDPNIKWVQLTWPINGTSSILIGFMDVRTILPDCSYESLNVIRDGRLPIVAPPSTLNAPLVAGGPTLVYVSPFGRNFAITPIPSTVDYNQIPPARMGSFGLHFGPDPLQGFGTTLDIVPVNSELCIDTQTLATQSICDPPATPPSISSRIPVYSPVTGCALYNTTAKQIEISLTLNSSGALDCTASIETNDRQIIMTHVTVPLVPSNGNRVLVQAGQQVASLCRHNERSLVCGITNPMVQNHLAYQPRLWNPGTIPTNGNLGSQTDITREVIGVLVQPYCLYDTWASGPGQSPATPSTPIVGCP